MIGKIGTGTVFPLTCIVKRQGIANFIARNALPQKWENGTCPYFPAYAVRVQ